MTRDWKFGDMARTVAGGTIARTATHRWILLDDGHPINPDEGRIAHPLVVIDPEDREQVERLRGIVDGSDGPGFSNDLELWQAALREFANPTPPKPEEPTGLGAVVEDDKGRRWTRADDTDCVKPWHRNGSYDASEYADIAAVRVLSEGVTP